MKKGTRVYRPFRGYGWVVKLHPRRGDHVWVRWFPRYGLSLEHTWALQLVDETTAQGWEASKDRAIARA
jgi:hypothetical protein